MKNHIGAFSLLLTFVAGFTDSATFIGADKLFSAHVTGNFVVLAYDLIQGADRSDYAKLLAFPVFVAAVMLAGRYDRRDPDPGHSKEGDPGRLMRLEGALLLLAALLVLLRHWISAGPWRPVFAARTGDPIFFCAEMLIVAAMAFQNAFGRLYAAATFGPTTVMTGNVTSAALDLVQGSMARPRDKEKIARFNRNLAMIGVFLAGCFCGGFLAHIFSLVVVVVPGLLVLALPLLVPGHLAKKP